MNTDKEKTKKFEELGEDNFAKAVWLTNRANYFGQNNMMAESITDFTEAIVLKNDHLPAYLGMAIAYSIKEQGNFNEGKKVIEKAPSEMRMGGKVIITKKDILKQFEEMMSKK